MATFLVKNIFKTKTPTRHSNLIIMMKASTKTVFYLANHSETSYRTVKKEKGLRKQSRQTGCILDGHSETIYRIRRLYQLHGGNGENISFWWKIHHFKAELFSWWMGAIRLIINIFHRSMMKRFPHIVERQNPSTLGRIFQSISEW